MATNTTILYYEIFRLTLLSLHFSESIDSLMMFIQFVLFVISPMIFCGYLLYWPVVVDLFSWVDTGITEPIMYVGMLIITIFEVSAVCLCTSAH